VVLIVDAGAVVVTTLMETEAGGSDAAADEESLAKIGEAVVLSTTLSSWILIAE
jgi:hypothetical protein